jgi:hypothetical protein
MRTNKNTGEYVQLTTLSNNKKTKGYFVRSIPDDNWYKKLGVKSDFSKMSGKIFVYNLKGKLISSAILVDGLVVNNLSQNQLSFNGNIKSNSWGYDENGLFSVTVYGYRRHNSWSDLIALAIFDSGNDVGFPLGSNYVPFYPFDPSYYYGPDTGGVGYNPYNPPLNYLPNIINDPTSPLFGREIAPDDFQIEHYWEDASYDDVFTIVQNPIYDGQGFRKNGDVFNYSEGNIQNYTNDNGGKYAVFTKNSGEKIYFPGATITDVGVMQNRGVTTGNGGIHASLSFSLAGLQHEYGHYLQALNYGSFIYNSKIVPASLWNMTFSPSTHNHFWTEKEANQLAINFFGNNSAIALNSTNYPR